MVMLYSQLVDLSEKGSNCRTNGVLQLEDGITHRQILCIYALGVGITFPC